MAVNWAAVWFGWKTANFISKPAIILALLGWFFSTAGFSTPALWFGIGLGCALAGDTLLLFKGKGFPARRGSLYADAQRIHHRL